MDDQPTGDPGGVEAHLRADERLLEERRVAGTSVSVTDRRVLMCSNDAGDIRAVDRTNVGAVEFRSSSDRDHLLSAALWAGLGVFLLVGRRFVPAQLFRPVDPPSGVGFEALFAAVNRLIALLSYLETAFLVVALLSFARAGYRSLRYVRSRERVLEVAVAGGEPIRFPAADSPEQAAELRSMLAVDDD